jgi:hypothetical protein
MAYTHYNDNCPNYTTERVDRSYIDERNKKILAALEQGFSINNVAGSFGLTKAWVKTIRRRSLMAQEIKCACS